MVANERKMVLRVINFILTVIYSFLLMNNLPQFCMEHYEFEPEIVVSGNTQSPGAFQVVRVKHRIPRSSE